MTAIAACLTCGTEPREGARFCDGCGSPVQDGDTRAEYKQVTVLFADVVHSMDIAAAVGTERLREIMAGLVDRAAAVVKRYGGTVDKFTGDGIMAVFGAPVALEDHALRACRAALEIHSAVSDLADEVRHRDGVDLRLRIGLNSGQVIAGEIGSGAAGYTTVGEQVGLAQRMESVAPPGGVMLSASTARLVETVASLGDPELVRIKGVDEPVRAQRLLGVSDRVHPATCAESALVGRRWEMAANSPRPNLRPDVELWHAKVENRVRSLYSRRCELARTGHIWRVRTARGARPPPTLARMHITVDYDLCEGHGQCLLAAPDVFDIPDDAEHVVVLNPDPPEADRDRVIRAAAMCPAQAIRILN